MKRKLSTCGIVLTVVLALQGCLKKEDGVDAKSSSSNDDRKVELIRWKKRIDTEYSNCISVPGRDATCKKEFDAAMVSYLKEQSKLN